MSTSTTTPLQPGFLAPPGLEPDCADEESADHEEEQRDADETEWLTPQEVAERFGRDRSTFQHAVARNVAGLLTARRRGRYYDSYEYPLWRVQRWFDGGQGQPTPTVVFSPEHDWYLDQIETQWLDVNDVLPRTGCKYATFMRAVSANLFGLRQARRRPQRQRAYRYPAWRIEQWEGTSALSAFTLPSLEEIRSYRAAQDAAASALALEVGFSPGEVSVAAATGDLPVQRDGNSGKILFMPPRQAQRWIGRDSWRNAS